jgi:hypothetical protein
MTTGASFDKEQAAVRSARQAVRAWAIALLAVAGLGVLALYLVRSPLVRTGSILDDNVFLLGAILIAVSLFLASRAAQWKILLHCDVHCTFCHRPLAERVRLLSSPSPICPHCQMRIFRGHA